jgi:hypothetical protein
VEAVPAVDQRELVRYQLITFGTVNGVDKALVKDLLKGSSRLIAVGEKIGDCKLVSIIRKDEAIRLKSDTGGEFTVKRAPPSK